MGLTLKVAKTQVLGIGASQENILFLSQSSIEKHSHLTYLGVRIDKKVAFTDQIHDIIKRTSKHLLIIVRLMHMVSSFFLLR